MNQFGITPDTCPVPECELANIAYRWKFFNENDISLETYLRNKNTDGDLDDEVELVSVGAQCIDGVNKALGNPNEHELSVLSNKLNHLMSEIEEFNTTEKTIKNIMSAYKLIGENVKLIFPTSNWEKKAGFKNTVDEIDWVITPIIGKKVTTKKFIQTVDEGLEVISQELDQYFIDHPELMDADSNARRLGIEKITPKQLLIVMYGVFLHSSVNMLHVSREDVATLKKTISIYIPLCDMVSRLLYILSPCNDMLAESGEVLRNKIKEVVDNFYNILKDGSIDEIRDAYDEIVTVIGGSKIFSLKIKENIDDGYLESVIPYPLSAIDAYRLAAYSDPEFWGEFGKEEKEDPASKPLGSGNTVLKEQKTPDHALVFLEGMYSRVIDIIDRKEREKQAGFKHTDDIFEDLFQLFLITTEINAHMEDITDAIDIYGTNEAECDLCTIVLTELTVFQDHAITLHGIFGKGDHLTKEDMIKRFSELDYNLRLLVSIMIPRMLKLYPEILQNMMVSLGRLQ